MDQSTTTARYYLLYLPLLVSLFFISNPVVSYLLAWGGSFFIFYVSFTNKVKPTSIDVPLAEKILKPLFLLQIIFAGYMSCSSIFFFLDQMGYEYFTRIPGKQVFMDDIRYTAACQRYYLLGHAAFAHGLLLFYKSDIKSNFDVTVANWPAFFLRVTLICTPLALLFSKISGLAVLSNSVEGLAIVAATIALALSIPMRQVPLIVVAGIIYGVKMAQALTSGFKEPVIVSVLMLGLFLYPFYKRTITLIFIPLMFMLFTVLPTYVNTFRKQQNEAQDAESAKAEAMKKVREDMAGDNLGETNWAFLTGRVSEIGMFIKYKQNIDEGADYYKFQIVGQSLIALVPRVLWPGKPITELVAMVRVLENGIVSEDAKLSAKPQYIVDGYLSGGAIGIWLALFFYGAIAQIACNKAEALFGSYFFGTAFIITGIFRAMWRGNCFEFIFNSIFYSFALLLALHFLFLQLRIVKRVSND
jgi:hypothetical protein